MPESARYSDFKNNFDVHPYTRDVALSTEEVAVKTAIKNIVFTGKYERFHRANIGAGVPQRLFENIGRNAEYEMNNRTQEAILQSEPRVTNVQVHTNIVDDQNRVNMYIVFTTINIPTPITLNLILKRVR